MVDESEPAYIMRSRSGRLQLVGMRTHFDILRCYLVGCSTQDLLDKYLSHLWELDSNTHPQQLHHIDVDGTAGT